MQISDLTKAYFKHTSDILPKIKENLRKILCIFGISGKSNKKLGYISSLTQEYLMHIIFKTQAYPRHI